MTDSKYDRSDRIGQYCIPNTGSPAEAAMVAAENALRTPLTEKGKFLMMNYVQAAMSALDNPQLRHDGITGDIARAKIGAAQRRFGL